MSVFGYHCLANICYSLLWNVHLKRTVFYFWFHDDFDQRLAHVNCVRVLRVLISRINSFIVQSSRWIDWISWNNFNSAIICAINTTVLVVCCVSFSIYPEVSMKLLLQQIYFDISSLCIEKRPLQLIRWPLKNQCVYFVAANSVF